MTAHQRSEMTFDIYDTNGQPIARTTTITGAIFIADLNNGYYEVAPGIGRDAANETASFEVILRSQLRRVMWSGRVRAYEVRGIVRFQVAGW
ncbi:MAG: hypothetical protein KL863_05180 [Rhizobium sp.]|nr:hypothetical protein [Rhizobium sp.]